jgi:probable rRNA maturation factor
LAVIYRVRILPRGVKIPIGIRMVVRRTCNSVLKLENFDGSAEVNIIISDNSYIQELNNQYRKENSATDVLSFPASENGKWDVNPETGMKLLGDIVVSIDKASEQAENFGHDLKREMVNLIAHGMLHLLGYDHEKGKASYGLMKEREEKVMAAMGFPEIMYNI